MIRIGLGQIKTLKADYEGNLERIGRAVEEAVGWERPADLVIFPETATSGYYLEGGVGDVAVTAGQLYQDLEGRMAGLSRPVDISVGFYEVFENQYFNSSMYASIGGGNPGIKHVHRKVFLPTYGTFDEHRYVGQGHSIEAFDTGWGRAAMIVCEDAWHSLVPTIAALKGAQLVIIPGASPARGVESRPAGESSRPSSVARWERVLKSISEEHGVYTAACQLVGFEGGKGFPGASTVVGPTGRVEATAPLFEECVLPVDIDLDLITRVRADAPLLNDLEAELPHLVKQLSGDPKPARFEGPRASRSRVAVARDEDPLSIDGELVTRWLESFIVDEVSHRRGFTKAIVAVSGGVDSAVTATLAARSLGAENVIGLWLPSDSSSKVSHEHAVALAESIGIELRTLSISDAVAGYTTGLGDEPDPTRSGNIMARLRMIAVFDLSAHYRALPLGTGNKTERLLGYYTWHADDSPPINPIGDLFKSQVWALARHLGVPNEIVEKPATADLIVGQTDEADLGVSYDVADHVLHWLLSGLTPEEVVSLGYSEADVQTVHKRLTGTHWKRRLPTVAMVSQTAIGEYYLRPVDY